MWRILPGLLLAPLLVLGHLQVLYALATPACSHQAAGWLHTLSGLAVLAGLVMTGLAGHESVRLHKAHGPGLSPDTDRHGPQRLFLAHVATGTGALSSLTLLALWLPVWVLSPCWH